MNMKHALAPVAALLVGVSILLTGQGLQGTLLPVRAALENFSTLSIGIIGGAYFLGFTLGCLKCGELVQRVGHVRVFAAMTALASATPLLHGLILNPWTWGLLRFLTGFCFAILYVVIESWLNDRSSNENRGIVFSTYVMITLTVLAAGQMMTLLYDPSDMHLFAIASILVSVAAIPVVLSKSESPDIPETVELDIRRLYRISPAGMIGCVTVGLTNGAFWSLAPVFTAGYSTDASLAAWFMTSAVFGGAILQWPLGFLSDRFGRRKVMIAATTTSSAVAILIVFTIGSQSFAGINLLGMAWGSMAFPLYAIAVAHANDHAEPHEFVTVSGGLLLMYGGGAIVGPFLASAVMEFTNESGLYLYTAAIHLLLVVYVSIRMTQRETTTADQHVPFSDALATAHTASQFYNEKMQSNADEDGERATD
jgi:MFS family permease